MNEHCNRCVHDHGTHRDEWTDNGCEHILSTILETFDPVFIRTVETIVREDGTSWDWHSWDCVEFSRCPCDRRDDPGVPMVPPPDPNQLVLFDASMLMPGVWRDVVLDELQLTTTSRSSHG